MLLPFWYAKQPMFWLPQSWFPYYIEWVLSFPRAPIGSISIASWQLACTGVVMIVNDTIIAVLALIQEARIKQAQNKRATGAQKRKETPMAASTEKTEAKKEL